MPALPERREPSTVEPSPAAPAHPLTNSRFRRLWVGSVISLVGDQFYLVALPWVVLQITGSAVAMGTILMAASIPRAVLMLMGGAMADQLSPRRILLGTAFGRTIVVGAVGALLWFRVLQTWELYVLGLAFGVADAFSLPASSAFMPSIVGREQLVAANSVMQTTAQLTTIAGPAPAGLVIKALGAAWAFVIDAISFLFIIAALWTLPDPPRAAAQKKPVMWQSVLEGIRYVRQDGPLTSLMLLAAMLNVCISGPMTVGLAYMAKTRLGSPAAFGFAVSSLAAGGLAGALTAGLVKVKRRGVLLLVASATIGACLAAFGFLYQLATIAALLVVMAACAAVTNIHLASWIQGRVDLAVRGRVVSVLMLSAIGLQPISLAGAGLLAAWNLTGMFLVAAAALLTATIAGAMQPSVRAIA
jgi:Transmembrane secretion effector